MKKEIVKDIAVSLIGKSGYCFDGCAFDETTLSESDKEKILQEIFIYCEKIFKKIEKKYDIKLKATSHEVVNDILNASKRKK